MQLFSAKQIQNLESETIKSGHISNYNLMIKASTLFANWVDKKLLRDNMPIAILCGHGNNGGDGYAIAQILRERKSPVVCYDLSFDNEFSTLCKRTKSEFEGKIIEVSKLEDLHELSSYALVLDAILGIGCSRAFDKNVLPFIQYINNEAKHIMSVDIPSGMLADMKTDHDTILAQETLTFSAPKLAFFSSTNAERLGKWVYRDIGLLDKPLDPQLPIFMDRSFVAGRLKTRATFSHKGSFGHVLVLGSAVGMAGASILAGRAAFRIGSGLVSIASPSCNRVIMQSQLPEAMFLSVGHEQLDEIDFDVNSFTCLCVGTGLGQAEETKLALKSLLNEVEIPIVIDADALNIIASFSEKKFPKHSIITPHPKEFDRLFGDSVDDFERRSLQKRMSAKHDIIIILKGAYSTISFPDGQFYYNSTGNPGMAVGGSGDILSGTIAGLLAQGYTGLESALLGTYIHGLAGDIAAKNLGQMNMISSDMIDQYSLALNMIK